jgi:hypothetical protein
LSEKAFIILKPKRSFTLVNFWKLKCDCFVIEAFLVYNIGMTIWEVLLKFSIYCLWSKKIIYTTCSWEGCKNVKHSKLFLPLNLSCLCKIFCSLIIPIHFIHDLIEQKNQFANVQLLHVRCKQMWWRTIPIQIG